MKPSSTSSRGERTTSQFCAKVERKRVEDKTTTPFVLRHFLRHLIKCHRVSKIFRNSGFLLYRTRKPQKYDNSGVLWNRLVGPDGLEPPTKGLWVPCSNQLSYGPEVSILYPILGRNQAVAFLEVPRSQTGFSTSKTIDGFPSCAA